MDYTIRLVISCSFYDERDKGVIETYDYQEKGYNRDPVYVADRD